MLVGEEVRKKPPTYPELCHIEDFEIMDAGKRCFKVSEYEKMFRDEIIPYWQVGLRDLLLNNMTRWKDCYDAGIFTEFMEQRSPGHTVADSKIYQKLSGL